MNPVRKSVRLSLLAALTASLAACNTVTPPPTTYQSRDWRGEVIYFALTDRFANGTTANDSGPNRNAGDVADRSNPLAWHGGDFAGLKAKIQEGYFKQMGFTAIWISPVVLQVPAIAGPTSGPNTGKTFAGYHGYWAEDFFKVDPHFGTLAEYKDLIATAHMNDIRIIQDVVVNHAGYDAALMKTHPDWFHTEGECKASANQTTDCPLAGLPDFKQDVPAVTKYLNDFVTYWRSETGIDGLRIDTMKHVPDDYWKQFFAAGGPGDPAKIWSVGEVFDGNPSYLAHFMNDLGAPSVFDFPLYFGLKDNLTSAGGNLDNVANVFAQDGVYRDATRLTTFVDNHDVKRFVNEVTDRGGTGTQAAERLDMALSTIYFSRGTPSVYQGTEIAQPGAGDPYNYPTGQGNREDMNFAAVASSPLKERLGALVQARARYAALRSGTQQELWRPNGGAPILAYRRTVSGVSGSGGQPVVFVLNNSDQPVNLADLSGGGIPLLGTFSNVPLTEVTGRANPLSVSGGKLVGVIPARTVLAVTAPAGPGVSGTVNPALPEPASLQATPGENAVQLTWTPGTDPGVSGYRVYVTPVGGTERLLNFAPLPADQGRYLARGLPNGVAATFRVVTVDASGAESRGTTVTATPSSDIKVAVTFTVDARTQGNGPIQLRRFDTGSEQRLPMTEESRGQWKTTIELPLFREIKFKFGNASPAARNSGYEGPGQGDRSYTVGTNGNVYSGVYDFISEPVPAALVEGSVTGAGQPLKDALVEATSANPGLNYALTFADGRYSLRVPTGAHTLKASADGYTAATQTASAPATGVNFNLAASGVPAGPTVGKYVINGDLSDWTAPRVNVQSPNAGGWGDGNNFISLRADRDAQYLYLAYTYTASDNNSAIVYLDTASGGTTDANTLDAWARKATFGGNMSGIEAFIARYGTEAPQLRLVSGSVTTLVSANGYAVGTTTSAGVQTVEFAVPWAALGLSTAPGSVNVVGGIFGGDNYGAGDIIPDAGSTPPGANSIGPDSAQRVVTFGDPVRVP